MVTSSEINSFTSIPLNKLVPYKDNVRKTGAKDGIGELQASIAAMGVLQSLVVKKTSRGKFAVIAGQRRYLALSALAGDGAIASDAPVPCHIMPGTADATEIGLTENVVRAPMHPADQFEAYRELVDAGSSPADIAARFGISETAVKQRLKLARVSPTVFQAYRDGELTLEQVQAFTVSDDHAAQDTVLENLSEWNGDAEHIRDALTQDEIRATDKRARFVTLTAYEEAGGGIRRDLFAEDDEGVFLLDAALLNRLALEKLQMEAEAIKAEGWKWVEAVLELDYEARSDFTVRRPEPLPLSEEAAAEQKRLSQEYQTLFESQDEHDEESSARLDEIETRISELEDTESAFTPEVLAIAGAIVSIGRNGEVEISRGFVRHEDEPEGEATHNTLKSEGRPEFSAPLMQSLTEARSAAISAALSERSDIALAAMVHAMALSAFGSFSKGSSLTVSGSVTRFREESKGSEALQLIGERWAERIPGDQHAMWEWCLAQDQSTLLELLAFCAASTVNVVLTKQDRPGEARFAHADALATALNFDMTSWFTPTAENYFSRVGRTSIVKAMAEAKNTQAKRSWDKLKKSELALLAEREIAGTSWLPQPLRA